jgi:Winged helix-turn-helix domain (DUF2582)
MEMEEEIGTAAGAIWQTLDAGGEVTLPILKKMVDCDPTVFQWAIGWLAREGKIVISRQKRSFSVRLPHQQAVGAGS